MKINQLVRKRDKLREKGKVISRHVKHYKSPSIRVMSNIEKPWWGRQAMTPNMWEK